MVSTLILAASPGHSGSAVSALRLVAVVWSAIPRSFAYCTCGIQGEDLAEGALLFHSLQKITDSNMTASTDDFPALQNDLILRVARGEKVERAPCWIMRQAGRYLPGTRLSHPSFALTWVQNSARFESTMISSLCAKHPSWPAKSPCSQLTAMQASWTHPSSFPTSLLFPRQWA